jgi:hypothetical protein
MTDAVAVHECLCIRAILHRENGGARRMCETMLGVSSGCPEDCASSLGRGLFLFGEGAPQTASSWDEYIEIYYAAWIISSTSNAHTHCRRCVALPARDATNYTDSHRNENQFLCEYQKGEKYIMHTFFGSDVKD